LPETAAVCKPRCGTVEKRPSSTNSFLKKKKKGLTLGNYVELCLCFVESRAGGHGFEERRREGAGKMK